jgi:hypothetical protein
MGNENAKKIGNLTELQCITKLYELGFAVSIPFGNSEKYDAIIEKDNKLYKIQIKHANPHKDELNEIDYISIKCTWEGHNRTGYTRNTYTKEEIDYFATFYEGECYLIPIEECSQQKSLRIKKPKNNQTKGISFLENYNVKEVLKNL